MINELSKNELFKEINSKKLKKYLEEKKVNRSEVCTRAYLNRHFLNDIIRKGKTRISSFNVICDELGVPRDYFDKPEEPEPVPEPVKEPETEKADCGVDLSDIQYSLNIFESKLNQMLDKQIEQTALLQEQNNLLSEQNRILRGKLEKGERKNEVKGNTNNGGVHGYLVGSSFPFKA